MREKETEGEGLQNDNAWGYGVKKVKKEVYKWVLWFRYTVKNISRLLKMTSSK